MNPESLMCLDEECPPFFAYALARVKPNGKWAGPVVIAKRSGLSHRTVTRLGAKISWRGVKLDVASAFLHACGLRVGKTGVLIKNRMNSYKRWCVSQAVRPFHHLDDAQYRLFNERARKHNEAALRATRESQSSQS